MTNDERIKAIQGLLGVDQDGRFGANSYAALESLKAAATVTRPNIVWASSFADVGDLKSFRACKASGKTDRECFKVGDNGEGYGGMITATTDRNIAALPRKVIEAKWGSLVKGHGKPIEVTHNGKSVKGVVGDYMSPGLKATIDLNPGFQTAFGVEPPFMIEVTWKWED